MAFIAGVRGKLQELCRELTQKGIRYPVRVEDMGVAEGGEPRLFIGMGLELEKDRRTLEEYYSRAI